MMFLLQLAFKNLKRRRRRTLFTVLGISFGVWLTLVFFGITNYNYAKLIDNSAKMSYGHLSFVKKSYLLQSSARNSVSVTSQQYQSVSNINNVNKVIPRIMISASAMSAKKNLPVAVMAIDYNREDSKSNAFIDHLVEGELPTSDDEKSVFIGQALLSKLGLRLGQKLVIQFTDKAGDVQSELLWIRATFDTGSETIDTGTVLVPLNIMQKYLGYEKNEYSYLAFLIKDQRLLSDTEQASQKILSDNPSGEVVSWKDSQKSLLAMIELDRSSGLFFIFILSLIVTLGNLNTILMSVLERRKEFGMMLAIGMYPSQLIMNIIFEAFCMSLMGVFAGFILGSISNVYLINVGIDLTTMLGGTEVGNSIFEPILRSRLYLADYLKSGCAFILLTIIASLYPAFKIRKLNPMEVLTR